MKKFLLTIILGVLVFSLFGQTQSELNNNSKSEYLKADKELNQVYQTLLRNYKSDTIFIKKTKEAQKRWIKYRDAQIEMKFPPYKDANKSVLPMCVNYYLKELTTNRITELKQWIEGVEEGDICSGSIRLKGN